jgi:hypothetical protein
MSLNKTFAEVGLTLEPGPLLQNHVIIHSAVFEFDYNNKSAFTALFHPMACNLAQARWDDYYPGLHRNQSGVSRSS